MRAFTSSVSLFAVFSQFAVCTLKFKCKVGASKAPWRMFCFKLVHLSASFSSIPKSWHTVPTTLQGVNDVKSDANEHHSNPWPFLWQPVSLAFLTPSHVGNILERVDDSYLQWHCWWCRSLQNKIVSMSRLTEGVDLKEKNCEVDCQLVTSVTVGKNNNNNTNCTL